MIKSAYIHIPFCASICAYCDFCKLLYHEEWVHKYLHALACEIKSNYRGEKIKTLYIGGGTPSSLSVSELESLLEICKCFNLDNDYEYTVEANIENIDEAKAKLLKRYGVNRISIGVESFDEENLKLMNRHMDYQNLSNTLDLLRKNGINNINLDLMYALPNEEFKTLKKDLKKILKLKPTHISTYSLILEEHTKLYLKVKDYSKERHKVITYFEIGRLLNEAGGKYGDNIIEEYSKKLVVDVGKKYNRRTLFRMKQFYTVFSDEKVTTMLTQLTWSHYLLLLSFKDYDEIIYYINIAKDNNLTQRQLQEKIQSNEYKRLPIEVKNKLIKHEKLYVSDLIPNPIKIKNKNNYEVISEKNIAETNS